MIEKLKYKLRINFLNNIDFLKQSAFSYFVIIFNIAISLYAIKQNITILGKDVYGIWILFYGFFNLSVLLNLGFTAVSTINIGFNKTNSRVLFQGNFAMLLLQTFLFIFIIFFFYQRMDLVIKIPELQLTARNLLLTMSLGGVCYMISSFLESILFLNYKKIYLKNFIELARLALLYILFVIALSFNPNLFILGICFSLLNAVILLFTLSIFIKTTYLDWTWLKPDFTFLSKNLLAALSFWIPSLCFLVISQADGILISVFLKDLALITMYSQCYRLQDISLKFIRKFTETKLPKILHHFQQKENLIVFDIYKKLIISNLLLGILSALGIFLFGKFLLNLWLGDLIEFNEKIIYMFALLTISGCVHIVIWSFFNITNKKRPRIIVAVMEISLNLIFSFILIKKYGIIGLPIATFISQIAVIILGSYFFHSFKKDSKV